jgi:proline iminopeptidase
MDAFPEIEPYRAGVLAVSSRHSLYWEELGNPKGVPLVFLHGGPGSGTPLAYRRHFDPAFWRIVMFDQRGAGRSKPLGDLTDNTTQALIADTERLRRELGIERWAVAGASWGSTLALAYGEAHPDRCLGFLLRGVFLGRPQEIDWFMRGMGTVFPEAWRAFADFIPQAERGDLLGAYCRRLADPDPDVRLAAALAWSGYEGACSTLLPDPAARASFTERDAAIGLATIESHYFSRRLFLEDNQLLRDLGRIRDKPAVIVQGRYDIICPIITADELARAWPGADYQIEPAGGHSGADPAMAAAQIRGGESLKAALTGKGLHG